MARKVPVCQAEKSDQMELSGARDVERESENKRVSKKRPDQMERET